jgi:exosome complex component RRP45
MKLVSPQQGKPNEGFFKFNIEFSSLIHGSEYTNMTNILSEMRVDISRFIDKVLKSSRAIDRESLCIVQGRLVWSVQVDLFLLNEDGNLMDACFLATVLSLKNTRLPEVTIRKDRIRINEEKVKYLNVHHIPVCTTFYFIEGLEKYIVDANAKEEKLSSARLSICMNLWNEHLRFSRSRSPQNSSLYADSP